MDNDLESRHTPEMQEIIFATPRGLLRCGMMVLLAILMMLFGLAALVSYPDIVKSELKISHVSKPWAGTAKLAGTEGLPTYNNLSRPTGIFLGDMEIKQSDIDKVKEGLLVLIKIKRYPIEKYGMIRGAITSIADTVGNDGFYLVKAKFDIQRMPAQNHQIKLNHGMVADAEIITEDATIFQRITQSVFKGIVSK